MRHVVACRTPASQNAGGRRSWTRRKGPDSAVASGRRRQRRTPTGSDAARWMDLDPSSSCCGTLVISRHRMRKGCVTPLQALLDRYRAAPSYREQGTYFEELTVCYLRTEPAYRELYRSV